MENLYISDPPQQEAAGPPTGPASAGGNGGTTPLGRGAQQAQPASQQQPQLPAQMFTTAAQLLDLTDKKLVLVLRDGRKMMGVLRSWDQFANLVLQSTVERIFVPPKSSSGEGAAPARGIYADIPRGTFLVRGENVLLLGEIDLDKDDDPPVGYDRVNPEVVESLAKQKKAEDVAVEKEKHKKLSKLGFEGDNMGEIIL